MDIKGSIILLYSKTHSDDTVLDQVEKWYKTKYTSKKINEDLVVRARAASYEGMHQPLKNNLFPSDFVVLPDSGENSIKLHSKSKSHLLWYGQDNTFKQPKMYANVFIYTTDLQFNKTIESSIFLQIWFRLVKEYLREFLYTAEMASLNLNPTLNDNNIQFLFEGYSSSLQAFITETF